MKTIMFAAVAAFALTFANGASAQSKPKCPGSAVQASFSVWPAGNLRPNREVRGSHACGRELMCTGGNDPKAPVSRSCRWL